MKPLECPKCGMPPSATYKKEGKAVATCSHGHLWTYPKNEETKTIDMTPPALQKASKIIRAADPIFYRGLQETWNADKARNQHLIFVTEDKDYALQYAKDSNHLLAYHAKIKHPFDFGFRSLTTSVNFDEVLDRVRKGVLENFRAGKVSKEKGIQIVSDLKALHKSGHKEVWEWYMQTPELVHALKEAGYDAIKGNEGTSDDIITYGVFDHSQLSPVTVKLNAAQRLKHHLEASVTEQRMQALCDLIGEPEWMTLTATLLSDPRKLTASQKVEALDLWNKIKDIGMVTKITEFLQHLKGMAEKLVHELKVDLADIIEAFQSKPMLAFFKAIKFSLSILLKPIKAFAELYKDGILKVFHELHKTGVFQKLHSGAMKVDEFMDSHPILRRLAGPAIAGLLFWMWTSASFTSSPALDLDLTAMLKAALTGHWSAAELFTSKEGLAAIALLISGLAFPFPNPVWLSGGMPLNLLIALCYTAFRHAKTGVQELKKVKQHIKFAHV